MDPKSFPQNLDPKLKEAYDRVMGFAAKPTQAQPASQTPSPLGSDPVGTNQIPPMPSTPTPTFSTPSQVVQPEPPEVAMPPKPQQTIQHEIPPVGQTKPVSYQTESFSNNLIHTDPQPGSQPIAYQPVTQEPQYPPTSQPISPSPITEPTPSSPDSAGVQPDQPVSIPQTGTQKSEKKSSLLTIVIIVLGIIFLLIYTFFWIRFLDVTLPFALPF